MVSSLCVFLECEDSGLKALSHTTTSTVALWDGILDAASWGCPNAHCINMRTMALTSSSVCTTRSIAHSLSKGHLLTVMAPQRAYALQARSLRPGILLMVQPQRSCERCSVRHYCWYVVHMQLHAGHAAMYASS